MSGPQLALAVVGVLAVLALLGVGVLLVQLSSLRRQLAAAQAEVQSTGQSVSATAAETQQVSLQQQLPAVGEPDRVPGREIARRDDIAPVDVWGPALVRVAAVAYGVRQALAPANRDRIAALVRRDLRRRERLRRRAARRAARVLPIQAAAHSLPPAAAEPERRDIAS
jgi:hypothetical protein